MDKRRRWLNLARFLLLCAAGLLTNFLGAELNRALGRPLYLDTLGTVLAAALGGSIPGVLVGFITTLREGADSPVTFLGGLMLFVAIASSLFAYRGYFKKPQWLPVIILALTLLSSGIESILNLVLNSYQDEGNISAHLAAMGTGLVRGLLDKTIIVLLAALILRLLPDNMREKFAFLDWHRRRGTKAGVDQKTANRFSLRLKVILLVAVSTIVTAATVTFISYQHFQDASIQEQTTMANGLIYVIKNSLDPERIDAYLEEGKSAEGYLETEEVLRDLMNSADNVEYCYVYRILADGCHVVFDPDTEDTPGAEPGTVIGFDDAFASLLPALLAGERIDPVISNETYGWLLTVYEPVYDSAGECQCYIGVDINMNSVQAIGFHFLIRVLSLVLCFSVLILTVAFWAAEHYVIRPIDQMAAVAIGLAFDTEKARDASLESIRSLCISTGDEVENLYHALVRTTEGMVTTVLEIEHQTEVINKFQTGLILVLADLVESRDKCTGDHVRKTAAYTRVIMDEMRKEGIYTDRLTDEFVKDVEASAPLHDVGKIQVPDAILNKPGKLTDEEFAQMKKHTTAGAEILTRAMATVSEEDSGYLREARNLAHYHHEKWNGMGYPCGLKGEEIPLSARIMAVADVFDALVSTRSYKKGFPFEKAMDIIREGSGSHFDPNVAGAFLRAEDEVRRVMNTYMGPDAQPPAN